MLPSPNRHFCAPAANKFQIGHIYFSPYEEDVARRPMNPEVIISCVVAKNELK